MTLEESGFVLHRGCLTKAQVAELTDDFAHSGNRAGDRDVLDRSEALRAQVKRAFGLASMLFAGSRPKVLRCILFDKHPAANWSLSWHQDLNIKLADGGVLDWRELHRVVTLRLHLDPTPAENGALRVLPGSHRNGVLDDEARRSLDIPEVTLEAEPGDVLQMTPLLVHASFPSKKPARRRVVHVDYLIEA